MHGAQTVSRVPSGEAEESTATDWDAYYERPGKLAQFTRKITMSRLLRQFEHYHGDPGRARFLEFGGANSCFYETIARRLEPAKYTVIDLNRTGLELFRRKHGADPRVQVEEGDVRAHRPGREKADICYSVGLIEHFDQAGTREAIRGHFAATRPGGLVVLSFPTPTWLYRLSRKLIERLGMWAFPDERPLDISEVLEEAGRHGRVIDTNTNWWILLTQGIVTVENQKDDDRPDL